MERKVNSATKAAREDRYRKTAAVSSCKLEFEEGDACFICATETASGGKFGLLARRHHCRACGRSVCGKHSAQTMPVSGYASAERACDNCFAKLYLPVRPSSQPP